MGRAMNKFISDEPIRLQMIKDIFLETSNQALDVLIQIGVQDGDDAALIKYSEQDSLVVASDFIRGSEFYLFELGYLDYFDIGYYLIVANLSDIAAMGATPLALTTIIRYRNEITDEEFNQIVRGIKAAADFFNVQIIGGDIGSHSTNVLAATALGMVKTENALLRRGVRNDDLLCVTGKIGLPITALIYFKEVKPFNPGSLLSIEEENKILLSWQRPVARIEEGLLLSENKLANACQDISDGLKATIQQMSELNNQTFTIYAHKLPIDETTKKLACFLNIDPVKIAVSASVDFELMFTLSPHNQKLCSALLADKGCKFSVIGEVNKVNKNILVDSNGNEVELPGVVWKQQTGDYLKQIINRMN